MDACTKDIVAVDQTRFIGHEWKKNYVAYAHLGVSQSVCGVCWLVWIRYTGVVMLNIHHLEGNFSFLSTGVNSTSLNMSFIGC